MSADLHIHIFEGITEDDLASLDNSTFGSKYFQKGGSKSFVEACDAVFDTPNIWIGEVSWLKAAFLEDSDTYVPSTVMQVSEAISEDLPTIDDELIAKIRAAFDVPNDTSYRVADVHEVVDFLEQHRGKQVFTVSW